jgi:hypothetical protein
MPLADDLVGSQSVRHCQLSGRQAILTSRRVTRHYAGTGGTNVPKLGSQINRNCKQMHLQNFFLRFKVTHEDIWGS